MADYETELGIQLDTDLPKVTEAVGKLVGKLSELDPQLQKLYKTAAHINKLANGLKTLSKLNLDKLNSQIGGVVGAVEKLGEKLNTDDLENFDKRVNNIATSLNRFTKSLLKVNGMGDIDLSKLANLDVSQLSGLNSMLSNVNLDELTKTSSAINTLMNGLNKASGLRLDINIPDSITNKLDQAAQSVGKFLDNIKNLDIDKVKELKQIPSVMNKIAKMDISKIGQVFSTLTTQIQPFLAHLRESEAALQSLATSITALSKYKTNIERAAASVNKLDSASQKTRKSLLSMFSLGKIYWFINYTKQLARGFTNMVNKAIDFIEVENLFSRSMENMRDEAMKFQITMSEAFGLALPDMMKAQGLFNNILKSLGGINEMVSYNLSKNMTEMVVDFASLYNVSVESAITKLQSALTGQVRPIRSVSGMDITQSVLGSSLQEMGIYDRTITKLNQVEKRLVIIYTLQQQLARSNAMGDWARTIEQPANQTKVLTEQIKELGRWIGSVFMGTIGKVLPYINAFVMVLKEIAKTIAFFVGYTMPNSSGGTNILDQMVGDTDDIAGGIGDVNDALDETKKKMDNLGSFDEHNIINKQTDTGGGSSGSGAIGGMTVDDRILGALGDYDSMMESVQMKATAIRDRIMEWLGFTKTIDGLTGETVWKLGNGYTNLEKIRDILAIIGISLLSWKISKTVMDLFNVMSGSKPVTFIGKIVDGFRKLTSASGKTWKSVSLIGGKTAYLGAAQMLAGIFATVVAIGLRFYDLVVNNENFRRGLSVVGDIIGKIGSLIGTVFSGLEYIISNISNAIGITDEQGRGLAMTLGAIALLFTPAAPFAMAYLIFDGITRSVELLGYAFSPVIEQIDILGEASAQTKTNLQPMLDTMNDMEINLKKLDWGDLVPNEEDVNSAIATVEQFAQNMQTHIENAKNNAITALNKMFVNSAFSPQEQQEMLDKVNETYAKIAEDTKEKSEQITEIYRKASAENRALSAEEVTIIQENQEWLKKNAVQVLSESAEEQLKILENLESNVTALSVEQASAIIKSSIEAKNQTIADANQRYQEQMAIAEKLKKDGGAENEELANKIIAEAERQKNEAIANAEGMHTAIVDEMKEQNDDVAKLIDENTGDIKTKWDVFAENCATTFGNIKDNITTWADNTGKSIGKWADDTSNTISTWIDEKGKALSDWCDEKSKDFVDWSWDVQHNIESWATNTANQFGGWFRTTKDGFSNWWNNDIKPWFTVEKWAQLARDALDGLLGIFNNFELPSFDLSGIFGGSNSSGSKSSGSYKPVRSTARFYANGGYPNMGEVFVARESGPELVGMIGNKNAVANNNDIVAALSNGVAMAMISVITQTQSKSNGTNITNIYLDSKVIATAVKDEADEYTKQTGQPFFSL